VTISALNQGHTDHFSLILTPTLTVTDNLDLQSPESYDHDLYTCKRSKVIWFKRYAGNKRTDRTDCITFFANVVGNYFTL